jgi:hypothetical protein
MYDFLKIKVITRPFYDAVLLVECHVPVHLVESRLPSFVFDSHAFLTSGQRDDCCNKKTNLMVNGSQIYLVYGSESDIKRYHGWNDIQISKVKDVQHMEDKVKKQRTQKTKKKQKNQHSN